MCQQLGVPVQGSWKTCPLAIPAFARSWEGLKDIMILPDEMPVLSDARELVSALDSCSPAATEATASSTPERKNAEPLLV